MVYVQIAVVSLVVGVGVWYGLKRFVRWGNEQITKQMNANHLH